LGAENRIPPRGRESRIERSVIVSPLFNLAPAQPTGPTLRQVRPVLPLRGSAIAGSAKLTLAPDRRSIEIELSLVAARAVSVRLRRFEPAAGWHGDAAEREDLLLLEIAASIVPTEDGCTGGRWSLERRHACAAFEDAESLIEAGVHISSLRAGSIEGLRVDPAAPRPRDSREGYCRDRMLSEIEAAESSASAVAASRHVQLATLYARELRSAAHF
jgi:hypothetical protein